MIVLWQLESNNRNFVAHLGHRVFDVAISPNSAHISVTLENNKLYLLDA